MKFWTRFVLALVMIGTGGALQGQALGYTPPAYSAYISPSPGVWNAWSSAAAFGSLSYTPTAIGLYCQASAGSAWTPCVPGGSGSGVSSINSNTGAFTFTGSGVSCATTTCTFSGGGGGGIANVVISSNYSTIELAVAACGGTYPCQILVNSTLAQSTTGTYTLPTGVSLQFFAGGALSFSGKTLAFGSTSGVIVAPIANIGLGTGTVTGLNGLVPAEWFGAVGDGALGTGSGGTGTDNHVAIQAAINSLRNGQVLLQPKIYSIGTSTLSVTTSGVGIAGQTVGYAYPNATQPSTIIMSNSPTADMLDVTGTSPSAPLVWNRFDHFALHRVVTSTATTYGFNASFTGGMVVDNVTAEDSYIGMRFHACPSNGGAGVTNSGGEWGFSVVASSTYVGKTLYGLFLDSLDGNAENSLTLVNPQSALAQASNSINSYGIYVSGSAINDIEVYNAGIAATKYGIGIVATGGGVYAQSDLHFVQTTIDQFTTSGVYISGASSGSIHFNGGYVTSFGGGTGCAVDIEGSQGVSLSDLMLANSGVNENGICVNASNNIRLTGNYVHATSGYSINLTNSSAVTATGNDLNGGDTSGNASTALVNIDGSSSYDTITGNTLGGSATTGVSNAGSRICISGNTTSAGVTTGVTNSDPFVPTSNCNSIGQFSIIGTNSSYLFQSPGSIPAYFGSIVGVQAEYGFNGYYNGSNWVYGTNGAAGAIRFGSVSSGGFSLIEAPSGTAGGTISGMDSTYIAMAGQYANSLPQVMFNPKGVSFTMGTNTIVAFNQPYTVDNAATVQITTSAVENKALVLQGTSGQTADLLDCEASGSTTAICAIGPTGTMSSPQFIPTGSAPTVANGAGAGTSPGTPTITGTNQSGVLTVITGTVTTANATVATITFNGTLPTAPQGCHLEPRNAAAATNFTTEFTGAPSTTTWTLQSGAAALTVSTTFVWSYFCI